MASKYWIKLYHEILHDPKMGRLSDHLYRRCIEVFLLAGENDLDGALPDAEDMAWTLRTTTDDMLADLAQLAQVGIVIEQDGAWAVTHFAKRQDAAEPSERMARLRARRHKEEASVTGSYVPSDAPVTKRNTDTDTDTEADTDEECGATAPAASAATPAPTASVDDAASEQEPEKPKRNDIRSDPRSKHPAIQCVRGIMGGKYPPREMYDTILETLGERPDGVRAANCRKAWVERGFNRASWIWLTEWYAQGGPPAKAVPRSNGHGAGGGSAIDRVLRAEMNGGG